MADPANRTVAAGVDIGSTTTKAVLVQGGQVLAWAILPSGVRPAEAGSAVLAEVCRQAGLAGDRLGLVATTGYGRRLGHLGELVLTEIKAAALGVLFASAGETRPAAIIDVGGQDTKIITLKGDQIDDFAMNDKCAAGTGRFLEMLAKKLDLDYGDFAAAAARAETTIQMNSTCAVFAESEVVSLLARGVDKAQIAAAAHAAIAQRIAALARRAGGRPPYCCVGGGACNPALVKALGEALAAEVIVPENPQCIVALGAAVAAGRQLAGGP